MPELPSIPWLIIVTGAIIVFAILSLILRTKTRRSRLWEHIGSNDNQREIPRWVIAEFAKLPGSHGTDLIDYPEPGGVLHFRGRRFHYKIEMGKQSWQVYRRRRFIPYRSRRRRRRNA